MKSNDKVALANQALAKIRAEKREPTILEISRMTGISRTTLHSRLPQWVEFREALEGKVYDPLMEAQLELTETKLWQRDLKRLQERLGRSEAVLQELRDVSDSTFNAILEQLHQYFIVATKTPKELQKEAELRQEHAKYLARVRYLEATLERMNSEMALPDNVRPLGRKEVVDVIPAELRRQPFDVGALFDWHIDAVMKLDDFFLRENPSRPRAVYLMCGLPAAGKSRWIRSHQPATAGVTVYLDGTGHSRAIRTLLVKRVRKLSETAQIVCCRVTTDLERCLAADPDEARKKVGLSVGEGVIREVAAVFEEVGYDEGFDSIIPVAQ